MSLLTRTRTCETLVTLTCDAGLALEARLELLSYAFAKVCTGATVKEIRSWRIKDGTISFVLAGGPAVPGPRGEVHARIEDVPQVAADYERLD